MKSVIGKDGKAVGKNYVIDRLCRGDLGLTIIMDRGKCEAPSLEQRQAVASQLRLMLEDVELELGVGRPSESDSLRVGMGICIVSPESRDKNCYGVVEQMNKERVVLRTIRRGGTWVKIEFSRANVRIEDLEVTGEQKILVEVVLRECLPGRYSATYWRDDYIPLIEQMDEDSLFSIATRCHEITFLQAAISRMEDVKQLKNLAEQSKYDERRHRFPNDGMIGFVIDYAQARLRELRGK